MIAVPLLISLCVFLALSSPPGREHGDTQKVFVDAARRTGLEFRYLNGMTGEFLLPEITGGGAALIDFDRDGDLDVYLVQGSFTATDRKKGRLLFPWPGQSPPRDQLFRNQLQETGQLRFVDVTAASGIRALGYGMGAAAGDANNDGWVDLYVTNWGANQLWINNGDGTFRDATAQCGCDDPRWSSSASFFDYDRDGDLDLYLAHYVDATAHNNRTCFAKTSARDYCGPDAYAALPDRLFRNKGDGTFEDVSIASGIHHEFGAGLGVVTADFNGDGWVDIYVANDGDPNQLWINRRNGTFADEALLAGAALNREGKPEAGMGVDAGDFDGDGDEDLFITHLMEESNTLYVNQGNGFFEDRTIEAGLHLSSISYTAFGTGWLDYDNDGWLDLLSLNGAVRILEDLARQGDTYPLEQPNQLFHNTGQGTFEDATAQAGAVFHLAEVSRGAAIGDLDNDGDSDVIQVNSNGPVRVLLNQIGNRSNWIGLRLTASAGQDMLGTQVELIGPGKRVARRRARSDGSYCSSNDPRVLAGLGNWQGPVTARVFWPDGQLEVWRKLTVDRYHHLERGKGEKEGQALGQ